MAKTITLTVDKTNYTLEFNRRTVSWMEDEGFSPEQIADKPMNMITLLFRGAMRMHHPTLKNDEVDNLYIKIVNKSGLIGALMDMYNEVGNCLIDDPEESEGKAEWSLN